MQRLRRLYEEKENVNGFDKEVNLLTGPNYGKIMREDYGGYAGRLLRLCAEKSRDTDGSDKHRHSKH